MLSFRLPILSKYFLKYSKYLLCISTLSTAIFLSILYHKYTIPPISVCNTNHYRPVASEMHPPCVMSKLDRKLNEYLNRTSGFNRVCVEGDELFIGTISVFNLNYNLCGQNLPQFRDTGSEWIVKL